MKTETKVICDFCGKELDATSNISSSGDTVVIELRIEPCDNCLSEVMDKSLKDIRQKYKSKYKPEGEDPV